MIEDNFSCIPFIYLPKQRFKETKVAAYQALVRPQLEYAAPIWKLHHQTEIDRIEKVQRTAARWACRLWRNQSHVGEMLEELQWPELQERRQQASLTVFYKIHNNLFTIVKNRYLSQITGVPDPTPFSITDRMHIRRG